MWISTIVAYLHYLGFMLSFGALAVERIILKPDLSNKQAWNIVIADGVYGLSATVVLITGILRVLYFGKGSDYYLDNSAFYVKIGIFIVVGSISLYPTFSFLSWIKDLLDKKPPAIDLGKTNLLNTLISIELVGFTLIPLMAAMMARGIGANAVSAILSN